MAYHPVLVRQLRRIFGENYTVPTELAPLLTLISDAYMHADDDRMLTDRSLDISSREHAELRKKLEQELMRAKKSQEELAQSLSLLQATLDATADGILVVDREERIISYNQQFVHMWNIPPGVLAAKDDKKAIAYVLAQLVDPDAFQAKIRELYANPDAESFDVLQFHDHRVIERLSKPQFHNGQITGRVWSFRDVTARWNAQRALANSEARFGAFMRYSPMVAWMKDEAFRYVYINEAFARVFHINTDDVRTKTDFDLFPKDVAETLRANDMDIVASGSSKELEESVPTSDGASRVWAVYKFPFKDANGKPMTGGVAIDVTERKKEQDELRERKDELERMNKLMVGRELKMVQLKEEVARLTKILDLKV